MIISLFVNANYVSTIIGLVHVVLVTTANTVMESPSLKYISLTRTTTETKDLLNGLLKRKCQAAMREQNSQLRCLKERDQQLHELAALFKDPQITLSLYSPYLRQYSRLFVKRSEHDQCVDQYILLHFNGICIMGLAESHFFVRNHLQVQSLHYGVFVSFVFHIRLHDNTNQLRHVLSQESRKREVSGLMKMMLFVHSLLQLVKVFLLFLEFEVVYWN